MLSIRRSKSVRNESKLLRRASAAVIAEMLERRQLLTTIVVNSTSDAPALLNGAVDLRIAIGRANAATSSTTISFDPSVFGSNKTITLSGTPLELSNTKHSTTITGPSAGVVLSGANSMGVLQIDDKVTANLNHLTIANSIDGFADGSGGGIYNDGTATLSSVNVSNNSSPEGGGIYNDSDGTMRLTNGTISGNSAEGGGGIWNLGTMVLVGTTITGNGAEGEGGIANAGKMTLVDATVSKNAAGDEGGISNAGTMILTNVTVTGNTASGVEGDPGDAAGISNDGSSKLTMNNVTITGNSAGSNGTGGGVENHTGVINVGNSIIAGNTAQSGPDFLGTANSLGHNLIGKTNGSSGWKSSDLKGTTAHPLNADLGALANNGGSTLTLLPQSGSPAINAGSNSLIPTGITTDQRGDPRISGSSVDIGAVEVQLPTVISGTVFNDANKNGKKDSSEAGLAGWEVYDDANNNGKLDPGETLTYTTANGSYGLGILGTGTAHIREIIPANWSQTTPSNNGAITITLSPGSTHSNENFGDHTSIKYLSTVATTSGIVAWWTFDSSSQANSILNDYTGSLKGGATISSSAGAPINGESNNSGLSLNGTSAFVNTDLTTQQEFTTAATFNVWIDLGSTPAKSGHIYTIMAKSQFQNDLDLQVESDGSVHFYTDSGTSTSFKPSSLTGWHMITAEFDTSAKIRKIFWDGKQVASSTPGSHSASTGAFSIGESDVFTGRFFDGKIDEVSLFNDALTSGQISAIYNAAIG